MSHTLHSGADRSPLVADTVHEYGTDARTLCHRHAAALLTVASMVLDDIDTAVDIVAATIAAACRQDGAGASAERVGRMQLARSVYHRCLGHHAFVERFPELTQTHCRRQISPVDVLSPGQRAILALVLFGGHSVEQATEFLQKPINVARGSSRGRLR